MPAVLPVEAGGARLPAELAAVARGAGAGAVGGVAPAVHALAVALAAGPPQPLAALAAAGELLARRAVAHALRPAVAPVVARVADAAAGRLLAHGVDAAVADLRALRPPDARVAAALARGLVAFALLTGAGVLAVGSPAVGVACALAGHIVALPVGVAHALPLAVWAPELTGALCGGCVENTEVT